MPEKCSIISVEALMQNCVLGLHLTHFKYGKNSVEFVFTHWFLVFCTSLVQLGPVSVYSFVTVHEILGTFWMCTLLHIFVVASQSSLKE